MSTIWLNDVMTTVIEHSFDVRGFIEDEFHVQVTEGGDTLVMCPFHTDTNPSLSISSTGKAICFGCGFSARNIIDLYAKLHNFPYDRARSKLYELCVPCIPLDRVVVHQKILRTAVGALRYLGGPDRKLKDSTVSMFSLGYDPHTRRICIPIFDRFSSCVNIRMRSIVVGPMESTSKVINTKGHGEVRLYPEWLILDQDKLLMVEGEFDAMIGWQMGIPTVTWTGGASSWNDRQAWMLRGKTIVLLYDNDKAGAEGQAEQQKKLLKLSCHVVVMEPPIVETGGKDLTEWYKSKLARNYIKARFNEVIYKPMNLEEVDVCPYCNRPY